MAKFNDGDKAILSMPGVDYSGHVKATSDPALWTFIFDDRSQPDIDFTEDRLTAVAQ